MEKYMTTGIELKIATMAVKCLLLPLLVWFFYPIYDLILYFINDYALFSPFVKELFEDIKIILGAVIAVLVTIKFIFGIVKTRNEIKKIKGES